MANKERQPGMTPTYDEIVWEIDSIAALVFGVVQRHENMRDGVCHCTVQTMARLVGFSARAVQYRLRDLEDLGYIECIQLADRARHKPAVYHTTYTPMVQRGK